MARLVCVAGQFVNDVIDLSVGDEAGAISGRVACVRRIRGHHAHALAISREVVDGMQTASSAAGDRIRLVVFEGIGEQRPDIPWVKEGIVVAGTFDPGFG